MVFKALYIIFDANSAKKVVFVTLHMHVTCVLCVVPLNMCISGCAKRSHLIAMMCLFKLHHSVVCFRYSFFVDVACCCFCCCCALTSAYSFSLSKFQLISSH